MRLNLLAVVTVAALATVARTLPLEHQVCPSSDWLENGDFCYLLVKETSGRSFDDAKTDCRGRDPDADLLWLTGDDELAWLTDYSARNWNIKKDWGQCKDCSAVPEAAWIGAYRDTNDGQFKWLKNGLPVGVQLNWWIGHPKNSPADYVTAYDTGSAIRFRTEPNESGKKFWHFCKVQLRDATLGPTSASTTAPVPTREATTNEIIATSTKSEITTAIIPPALTTAKYEGACPSSDWLENGDFCYLLVKGTSGRSFDDAKTDCRGRDPDADLLWLTGNDELAWLTDYNARNWNIKKDWSQCTDCVAGVEAAWIGAYRDTSDGQFKWLKNGLTVGVQLKWWPGNPKESPADYVTADDTGSAIRFRTEPNENGRRFWHFCKVQHRESTTQTPLPTTTAPPYLGLCPSREWTEQEDSCYLLVKGENGRTFDEASRDCTSRNSKADLLWIESDTEAAWVMDNSKAAWNLKRDWNQCNDCQGDSTAWIGLWRVIGIHWAWKGYSGIYSINWFPGHPRHSPSDYGSLYDSGSSSQLKVRSKTSTSKMWHICKCPIRRQPAIGARSP